MEEVVTKTLESRPEHAARWSTRSMARAAGLNQNAIVRIWQAFGLKPHWQENFKLSTDPFFAPESARHRGALGEPARRNQGRRPLRG